MITNIIVADSSYELWSIGAIKGDAGSLDHGSYHINMYRVCQGDFNMLLVGPGSTLNPKP